MRIGLIGFGGIGATIARALNRSEDLPECDIVAVLVKPERVEADQNADTLGLKFVGSLSELVKLNPDSIVECAGHSAVAQFGEQILGKGIDLIVVSAGALADISLYTALTDAATSNCARIYVPSGALAGIDGLRAARIAGISRVRYTGRKPPSAWTGTPAEKFVSLNTLDESVKIFSGNARDAALQYPKNSNVAAIIALAGIGFDETEVELIADVGVTENHHEIEVVAETGNFKVSISGRALPSNPKTSALAAYSAISCLVDRQADLVF